MKPATREAAREAWAKADNDLRDAQHAVNGGPLGTRAHLLLGPLARTHRARRDVEQGRTLLTRCLTDDGMPLAEAAALVGRLETAYAVWLNTKEVR